MSLQHLLPALVHRRDVGLLASTVVFATFASATYAQRLPATVKPSHYKVQLAPDLKAETFSGHVAIDVDVQAVTTEVVLNALDLDVSEATITQGTQQAATVRIDKDRQQLTLSVPRPLSIGQATLAMSFSGELNKQLAGLYVGRTGERKYVATQFEATEARRAFPCFDEPAFKATYDVSAVIDEGDVAISNGAQVSDVPGPETRKHTVAFATTPKMSTYLVALFVGDFECIGNTVDGTPIRVCALAGQIGRGRFALEMAGRILHFFNDYFGAQYPFSKLDHVAIPDYAAGAMENTGAIVYREVLLLVDEKTAPPQQKRWVATVIAHEIAHQWFGDLVTMKWWDEIWLNEGFATWMQGKPLGSLDPEWKLLFAESRSRITALSSDALAAARPIRAPAETPGEITTLFDAIAFEKSAAVLHMLEQYVGAPAARDGVHAYLKRFAYANATSEDFAGALAETSGKPVDRVLASFVRQAGAPLVRVDAECSGDTARITLSQRRFFSDPDLAAKPSAENWELPVCLRSDGGDRQCHLLTGRHHEVTTPRCASWLLANAGGHGYYRTLYGAVARRALVAALDRLTPEERIAFFADEWAFVAPRLQTAPDYLELVNAARGERNRQAWTTLTAPLAHLHDEIVRDADRPEFGRWVMSITAPLLADLGTRPRPDDSDDRRQFRAQALWLAAAVGGDRTARDTFADVLDRYFRDPTQVDPSLVDAAIGVALRDANAATFERFLDSARKTSSPLDRARLLYALPGFHSETLVRRALDLVLTDDVRSQDALGMLHSALGNPVGRRAAWSYFKAHFDELSGKIGAGPGSGVVGLVGNLCDAELLQDAQRFFDDRKPAGFDRPLNRSVQQALACVQLKTAQQDPIREWLLRRLEDKRGER